MSATDTPEGHAAPQPALSDDDINVLELVNVLLRRWRLVIGLPVAAAVITGLVSLVIPKTYTARTAFVPELTTQANLPAGLSGLASQFGISLPGGAPQGANFYAQVLKSQDIMNRVLLSRFPDPRPGRHPADSVTLLAVLRVQGDSLADSLHHGRRKLNRLVSAEVDRETGIVTLEVDSPYPLLGAAVANRLIEYLNEFNAKTRQSQAQERRRFVEGRLAEAENDLQASEEAIKLFLERNRTWQQSPQLRFEHDRLERQVMIRQEVALTLHREYETARIAEVNDTPIITVIHQAIPPQQKSKPKRLLLIVLAFTFGGALSFLTAFGALFAEHERHTNQDQYAEFRRLVDRARGEIGMPATKKGS